MRRLAVVGAGLLGTSVALAARAAWPGIEIVTVDRRTSTRRARDAFDPPPDLVVLACPVDAIVDWLPRLAVVLPADQPITDVGSTKRAIVSAARRAGLRGFVGGHPMAGGTRRGPADARAHLFAGTPWLLVHATPRPGAAARRSFETVLDLVAACDARPVLLPSPAAHDRLVAAVSHLPQIAATALMIEAGEAAGADALALSGAGLRDTTRLAASEASVWASLLASNADLVAPRVRALARRLDRLADALDDPRRISDVFAQARRWRATLEQRARPL